jgi:transposase
MGSPYPLSVRRRIIELYDQGSETEEIAELFGYCVAGVRRVRQRFEETGSIEPKSGKRGRKPRFDEKGLKRLAEEVARKPDATLAELKAAVGVEADLTVYCRMLKRLALTRKKVHPCRRAGSPRRKAQAGLLARGSGGRADRSPGFHRRSRRGDRHAAQAWTLATRPAMRCARPAEPLENHDDDRRRSP